MHKVMFCVFFSLPIIGAWWTVSLSTFGEVNAWMGLLSLLFFFVPNWLSHELVPRTFLTKDPGLKKYLWTTFFRDRRREAEFRILFFCAGLATALGSLLANHLWGGTAFLKTIIGMTAVAFLSLHVLCVLIKERELEQ